MLVGADAARQDLRDVGVGDDREAEVDGAGGGRVLLVVDLAEREHEGEDAPLVVEEDLARLLEPARLEAAEGHRGAAGEAERVDERRGVGAVGDQERLPVHLARRGGGAARPCVSPLRVRAHEDEDVALLQVARELLGRLVVRQRADAGGEAGHAAVDELDPLLAQDAVGRGPEPEARRERNPAQRLERLDRLVRDERGRAGVERPAEVRQPDAARSAPAGASRAPRPSASSRSPSLSTRRPVSARMTGSAYAVPSKPTGVSRPSG